MKKHLLIASTLFVALLSANHANADELENPGSIFDHWRLYFYLGDYHAETSANQLESPGSEFAFGMGGLLDYSEYLDWGFDVFVVSRDYDTPDTVSGGPFTVVSDDVNLNTLGLNLTARLDYIAGIANFYASAGAGLYFTNLRISASTLGLLGSHEESSNDLGYFYNFGAAFNISDRGQLGVEYRELFLDAEFSPVTTREIGIGGDFLLLTYTHAF